MHPLQLKICRDYTDPCKDKQDLLQSFSSIVMA